MRAGRGPRSTAAAAAGVEQQVKLRAMVSVLNCFKRAIFASYCTPLQAWLHKDPHVEERVICKTSIMLSHPKQMHHLDLHDSLAESSHWIAPEFEVAFLITLQPGAQEKLQDATLQHLMQQQEVLQLYRSPGLSGSASAALLRKVRFLTSAAQPCLGGERIAY